MHFGARFKAARIHRHPASIIGKPGFNGNGGGGLRRDHIRHIHIVARAEFGFQNPLTRVNLHHLAITIAGNPFDHIPVKGAPTILEKPLFAEGFLGIQRQDFGPWLMLLQIMRNHADAFIRPGRAAEGIGRNGKANHATIRHRFQLASQQ